MRAERSALPLPVTVDSIDAQWLTIASGQRYPGVERDRPEETNTAYAVRFAMAAIDHRTFDLLLNQEPV